MIGKARTGADFGGLSNYLTAGGEERVSHVETRHTFEQDPAKVAQEMRDAASLSDRVEKPVYHLSVSFPVEDDTSQDERLEVMDELLEDLGLEGHQALIVEHQDEQHPHVHAMVNRVQHDPQAEGYAKAWTNSNDFRKIERSLRRMEKEREWREVAGYHARPEQAEKPSPAPTSGEIQWYKKTGDLPFGDVVSEVAGHHFEESESWADLEGRLREHGIWVEAKGRGGVVTDGEETAKLSDVGREYSRYKLEERFDQPHAEFREQRQRRDSQSDGERQADEAGFGRDSSRDRDPHREHRGAFQEGRRRQSHGGGRGGQAEGGPSGNEGRGDQHGADQAPVAGGAAGERGEDQGDEPKAREVYGRGGPREKPSGSQDGSEPGVGDENKGSEEGLGVGPRRDTGGQEVPENRHGRPEDFMVARDQNSYSLESGGDDVDGSDDLRLDVVRGATSSGGGEDDAGREGADRGRQGSKGSLSGTRRRRVRETPGPLEAGDRELSSSGPGMTDPESLDDREREVWARLSDGEKEAAAWAFDDLNESEQKELVRKIDQFDRKDLRAGFEAIIERQEEEAISQQESQSQDRDRSQSKSQGRGGRSRR